MKINVDKSHQDSILASAFDKVALHANTRSHGATLSQIDNLWIEHGRQPISGQDGKVKENLEAVKPLARGMVNWIIIEQEERFSTLAVWIFDCVVGVRMMLGQQKRTRDKIV